MKKTSKTEKKAARKKPTKKAAKPAGKKAAGKKSPGKRLTDKQRLLVLAKYEKLLAAGMKAPQAAKKVGVSYITLLAWRKKLGKTSTAKPGRKPGRRSAKKAKKAARKSSRKGSRKTAKKTRKAAPSGSTESLILITPSGYRIEGISPRDLITIMKSLG